MKTPGIPIPVCENCNVPMDLNPPVTRETEPDGTIVVVGNYKCQQCDKKKQRREPVK